MESIRKRIQHVAQEYSGGQISKLADMIGMNQGTVNNYAKGRNPNIEFVVRLKSTLGVDPSWLLIGEGEMTGPSGGPDTKIDVPTLTHAISVAMEAYMKQGRGDEPDQIAQTAAKIYTAILPEVLATRTRYERKEAGETTEQGAE